MNRFVLRTAAAVLVLAASAAQAQSCVSLAAVDTAYAETFDTLALSGSSSALPTGWALRETGTNANGLYTAGTGSSTAGDSYSFGSASATDRALGALRSGSLVPVIGACFRNDTGGEITALDLAYTGELWRLGVINRAADRIDFQYSLTATDLGTGTWIDVDALDFVTPVASPTVGARDGNDPVNRSALASTLAGVSIPAGATFWLRWTDFDIASSDDGLAVDDFALTARGAGISPPALSVGDATVDEGDAGTTPLFFTFTLNKPAGAGGVQIDYATSDASANVDDYTAAAGNVTIAEAATSVTISIDVTGDTETEGDETFVLTIVAATGATVSDDQAIGTIRNDDFVVSAIHDIQGAGATSPLANQFVTTTGIVTGRKNNGFFLQASDAEADTDPLTSEGVFVFTSSAPSAAVVVGNRVRVRGTVIEFIPPADPNQLPLTEITGNPIVTLLSSGHALPTPAPLTAAMTDPTGGFGQLEPLEGMRVSAASLTTIAATNGNATPFNATGSVNGIISAVVTGVPRPFREPGIAAPDAAPGGGSIPPIPQWDSNPEILTIDSDTLGGPAYLLNLPAGSVIEGLTGPLDYGFRRYTLHRDPAVAINVIAGPEPRAARLPSADEFTVAGYNLERFFDAVNDPGVDDSVATAAAYQKRLQKVSLSVRDYLHSPDVLVAVEVEKLAVLQDIAARINADALAAGQPDPQYVAYLEEGNDVGGIDIGLLVKIATVGAGIPRMQVTAVTQVGRDTTWEQPDGTSAVLNDRPPLMLDAVVHYADGRAFPITVIGVHQRSLIGAEEDTAGGARVRLKRQRQAEFLADLIQQRQLTSPHTRIVTLGDFNAFAFNDGLTDAMGVTGGTPVPDEQTVVPGDGIDLVNPDLVNLGELAPAAERYSFVFDGNAQTLDHVLVNEELIVTTRDLSVDHARINADFTDTNRSDATTPTRTADHDPVIAYFDPRPVADLVVAATADGSPVHIDQAMGFTASVRNDGPEAAEFVGVGFALDAELTTMTVNAPAGWSCDAPQIDSGRTSIACTTASLAKDAVAQFTISAIATQAVAQRAVTLAMAADAQSLDPQTANNQTSASITIIAEADLSISLSGPEKKLHYGHVAPFVLVVANAGPDAAWQSAVTLHGDAPAGHVAITAPSGWTCAVAADGGDNFIATCTREVLAIGASQRFDIALLVPARSDSAQLLTLNAVVGSAATETNPGDNNATYRNRIVGVP